MNIYILELEDRFRTLRSHDDTKLDSQYDNVNFSWPETLLNWKQKDPRMLKCIVYVQLYIEFERQLACFFNTYEIGFLKAESTMKKNTSSLCSPSWSGRETSSSWHGIYHKHSLKEIKTRTTKSKKLFLIMKKHPLFSNHRCQEIKCSCHKKLILNYFLTLFYNPDHCALQRFKDVLWLGWLIWD